MIMNLFEKKIWNEGKFDTDAPYHIECRNCGTFVVGNGECIACKDKSELNKIYHEKTGKILLNG
jgi:ribosomal protein L37E